MGDRTTVEITLRQEDFDEMVKEGKDQYYIGCETPNENGTICLYADECNYGAWKEVEDYLHENEIEYDKAWGAGSGYGAGYTYGRRIKGAYQTIESYETEESLTEFVKELKKKLDNKEEVKDAILQKHDELVPFEIEPLDKPNSIHFITEDEDET